MLILITGVPGSGKTLYAVQELENYKKENEKLIEAGQPPREIYADIDGLNIEGVKQSPVDWRDCPDGSIVFYDECQQKFGPDGQGRSGRADIQEFETHRHRGFDIVLITQHPKLLHAHIRRLIGRHYHVFRMYGAQTAKIFRRDGQMDIDKPSALNQQDHFMWSYPKENFGKYKSATIHTHKRHLPAWIKRSLLGMGIAGAVMFGLLPMAMPFFTGSFYEETLATSDAVPEAQTKSFLTTEQPVLITPQQKPVACIANQDKCWCYDQDGFTIDMPFHACYDHTVGQASFIDMRPQQRGAVATAAPGVIKPNSNL